MKELFIITFLLLYLNSCSKEEKHYTNFEKGRFSLIYESEDFVDANTGISKDNFKDLFWQEYSKINDSVYTLRQKNRGITTDTVYLREDTLYNFHDKSKIKLSAKAYFSGDTLIYNSGYNSEYIDDFTLKMLSPD